MNALLLGTLPGSEGSVRNGLAMSKPYLSQPQKDMLALAARTGRVRLETLPRKLGRTPEQVMHTAASLAVCGMAVIEGGRSASWLAITSRGRQAVSR